MRRARQRRPCLAAAGIALALALGSCREAGEAAPAAAGDGELRMVIIGRLDGTQPSRPLSGPGAILLGATQIGLVELDGEGRVVPALAMSWHVSQDGLSYIFRLRQAEWADGRAITAGDVTAVLRRVLAKGSAHPLAPYLFAIENARAVAAGDKPASALGVEALDDNIVEIRLTSPQPELLTMLGHPSLAIIRSGKSPPAGGAFEAASGKGDASSIILERNDDYFDAEAVPLSRASLAVTPDELSAVTAFRAGDADVVTGATFVGLGEARTVAGQNVLRLERTWGVYGYLPNPRSGPLADVRLRRALSMAIDRQALVDRLFAIPAMEPVLGLAPPGLPTAEPAAVAEWAAWPPEARIEEARRLLGESGYGADNPLTLQVRLPRGREHANVLQAVANDWARIGVTVQQVVGPSDSAAADPFAGGEVDLVLTERIAPMDSHLFFLAPFACASAPAHCNEQADALLEAAKGAPTIQERSAKLRSAEELLIADATLIPLFVPVRWALVSPRVSGWSQNILGAHPLSRLDVLPQRRRG